MSPRAKRQAHPQRELSGPTLGILRRVHLGDLLWGERLFPYPYIYKIRCNDDTESVSEHAIASLISLGVITASQPNPIADRIDYTITAEGVRYVKDGPLPPDDSQLDWVGVA